MKALRCEAGCPQAARRALAGMGGFGLASIRGCCERLLAKPDASNSSLSRLGGVSQVRGQGSVGHLPRGCALSPGVASVDGPCVWVFLLWVIPRSTGAQVGVLMVGGFGKCAQVRGVSPGGSGPFRAAISQCFMHKRCYASFCGCLTTHDRFSVQASPGACGVFAHATPPPPVPLAAHATNTSSTPASRRRPSNTCMIRLSSWGSHHHDHSPVRGTP